MINVLRGYRFLFITTAIVSFWPIEGVNADPSDFRKKCDDSEGTYVCDDGKKHTIKNKTYNLKSSQTPHFDTISALDVEKEGTVVDASQITITGDNSSQIFTYGASAKYGARLNLKDSNFKNVQALHATNAVIHMTLGSITGSSHAVYAIGKGAEIALMGVKVEIEPHNLQDVGFVSRLGAKIEMAVSTVTFNGKGTFSSFYGGGYTFVNTVIKGHGTRKTVIIDEESIDKLPGAFDVLQGSNVQLRHSSIELNDMHSFWVKNSAVDVNDKGNLLWEAFSSSNEFKKTDIKIQNSDISVKGEGAHGLYFYGLRPDEWFRMSHSFNEVLLQGKNIIIGKASVRLSETNLIVPEGIAIYSTGDKGFGGVATVELLENTKISGDLLLKTENVSSLLVKAHSSTLKGGIRMEDNSRIDLQLKNGSTWYLTKSKYQGLEEDDVTVSVVSSLSLFDSTLVFEKYVSQDYHTLYIGNTMYNGANVRALNNIDKTEGKDNVYNKVYSAEGNSRIRMSAFMNNDGLFDPQKTDLILIYGDVFGTTLIDIEKFQKTSEKEVINLNHQSVSIIQVFGEAKEDSFKLLSDYVAINGFPYQYKLRAYGPSSSSGKADPKNRLIVGGEGDFWDFRLESVYIDPKSDSSESAFKPTSTVLPPKSEVETIPFERSTDTILPEQPPSVEPPLIPSASSLPEGSEASETFIPTDSTLIPFASIPSEFPFVPTVPENPSAVSTPSASFIPVETSTDEVLPSGSSAPVSSSSTDSVSLPPESVEPKPSELPSVPIVSENFSTVPMPLAPFVPVETSTDEALPSEPSVPISSSSTDSVSPPSASVEPKPSELLSGPIVSENSSTVPMPALFVPVETSTDEVLPSGSSASVSSSSTDFDPVSPPSASVEPKPSELLSGPIVSENSSTVPMPAPFFPVETSTDEVLPSGPSASVSSSSTDSDLVPPPSASVEPKPSELPSGPIVSENSSTVPMPAPFFPVETSTDEVLPSGSSASVSSSSTDSDLVPPPSASVESKPSTSSNTLDSSSNFPMPLDVPLELGIRAVVPQVPTYLLLPNAFFHAGLMDMTTQNKKLETMRGAFHSSLKEDENTAFFLRAYGGSHHYTSNLSAFEYGYGAELDYNAFQAGVLLNGIESLYTRTFFGALGNYGNLSLHPQKVEQSKKSTFNKWSVGAYGSLQHDTGFYMNGVLSYGLFKGDVLTLARGKVVALKGKQFSGSLTSGRTFAIGHKGIVFDPQVQIVYQYLQFHQALDVDNLDVDLGKFHQWIGRVGGRLSKMLGVSEKGREVSFYSKLSYLHSFENKQFVSFKNDFQLGCFGSSLEAGMGFNVHLSSKFSLHGDITYQHKLKKVGFSGASFSAGLRHLF